VLKRKLAKPVPGLLIGLVGVVGVVLVSCDRAPEAGAALPVHRVFGEPGRQPGQFMYPRAIDSDGDSLWVVDKGARIQQIDPQTGQARRGFQTPAWAQGKPTGLTVGPLPGDDPRPALYVADTHYHRVLVYDLESGSDEPALMFGAYGTGPGQFVYPTDVAVLQGEDGRVQRLYVSEYGGNDRVSIFSPDLQFLSSFGAYGVAEESSPTQAVFDRPQSIAIDERSNELIVADACNHRLGRFSLEGELLGWIGGDDRFRYPYGLAMLDDDTVLVAEFGGNRIAHVDPRTGEDLGVFGRAGRGPGELASPWAVTAIGREVYVLDSGNNRIEVIAAPRPVGGVR